MLQSLKVNEIYTSIQGEGAFAGYPCLFIRLSGCSLRCRWCDTSYAFDHGKEYDLEAILEKARHSNIKVVELTGGEPLDQPGASDLLDALVASGFTTLLETSGAVSIAGLNKAVHIIMDIKCPDSKMHDRNLWSNIDFLKPTDEVKFVLASEQDYLWALETIDRYKLHNLCKIVFSTAFGLMKPLDLAERLSKDAGNPEISPVVNQVRMQLQMHKYIWPPRKRGV